MIPLCVPEIRGNEWKYVKDCLDTNWVSSAGSYVDRFEKDFAQYLDVQRAVVTMNGTVALQLALLALGIGSGDEVIVSSMTFISPVNAIRYVGAEPVFADVREDTWVLDERQIEALISPRTKAILPIHIYGQPVNMSKVMEIAEKHHLYVIEDATESLGASWNGQKVGTIGDIGCFSFNGNKLMTTGAGGMLVTNNEQIGERAKYLSTQTKTIRENGSFFHEEVGYNFRMPNLLAAMGCAQLEKIDEYSLLKRNHARLYNELLHKIPGLILPANEEGFQNAYWLYSVLVTHDFPISRDQLIDHLRENGIQSRPFFQPVHEMPPYSGSRTSLDMSATVHTSTFGLNLPSSVGLTEDQIRYICNTIRNLDL
ncbi:aminotransferase class I/II-fold pyridoxal phosphate-dependent enzyme [Sporolactobacillus shoreae]|uniref:Aminotransferase class I/II-fold pyridoxal phosphate-dependent enzyme n=1 Tax=Sporolactobacillus shoreae TaxID=1465501 RepID=A0A4Z0GMK3_9BACL|nr:aminotransferase class I/II-fold pyridoxal phosphate-dependent enzyme [Sporolactobacillus shoreae]TGA97406.1 aminotransferase class I/II-fold pyridoxal phosphate-dependent enzyme [Sporolactobacillus shoreae]